MVTIFKTAKGALIAGDVFCFLKVVFVFPTYILNSIPVSLISICFPPRIDFVEAVKTFMECLEVLVKNYEQGKNTALVLCTRCNS